MIWDWIAGGIIVGGLLVLSIIFWPSAEELDAWRRNHR